MDAEQVKAVFVGSREQPWFNAVLALIAGFRESEIQTACDVSKLTPDERTAALGGVDVLDRLKRDLIMRAEKADRKD